MIGSIRHAAEATGFQSAPTLWSSVLWRIVASLFGVTPYLVLYLTLLAILDDTLTMWSLAIATGSLLLAMGLEAFCVYKAEKAGFLGGIRMMSDLRLATADHLRKVPLGWFAHQQSGRLAQTLSENIQMAEELITHLASTILGNITVALFIALILLWADPLLGAIALISVPVGMLALMAVRRFFERLAVGRIFESGEAASRMLEYLQGIKVIRAFGLTGDKFNALDQSLRRFTNISIKLEVAGAAALMAFSVILETGFLIILVGGSYLMLGGDLAAPSLLLFLILSHRFYSPLSETVGMLAEARYFERNLATVQNVLSVPALPESTDAHDIDNYDLTVTDVSFRYEKSETDALSLISFFIPKGSLTAIVGPSGSGKTTLVHLISRFHDVTEGSIKLGGVDLREIPSPALLDAMSFVFQDVYLFKDSVAANIGVGRSDATHEDIVTAAKLARAHDFIMSLPDGYDTIVGEAGATLSSGERQRLSIARALLKNAPILILDEATASLDPENESEMQAGLTELIKDKTVIVIAHRLSSIVGADQILVLDKGRIVEQGRHDELLQLKRLYARLWGEQEKAGAFEFETTRSS